MTSEKLTPSELALLDVIKDIIAKDPFEFDGRLWCRRSQRELATAIGAESTKTVERALKKPRFVTDTATEAKIMGDGKTRIERFFLVRIGEPGEKPSPRTVAKMMRTAWRRWLEKNIPKRRKALEVEKEWLEKLALKASDPTEQKDTLDKLEKVSSLLETLRVNLTETTKEFGCFVGLAKDWPDGTQVEIFGIVLDSWQEFMMGVKYVQAHERAAGQSPRALFYDYPHIPTVRLYWKVALTVAETFYQDRYVKTGKHPPEGFKALKPSLWKHLK